MLRFKNFPDIVSLFRKTVGKWQDLMKSTGNWSLVLPFDKQGSFAFRFVKEIFRKKIKPSLSDKGHKTLWMIVVRE